VLVAVKLGGGSVAVTTEPAITPAPASLVSQLTGIPPSVYDQVGVDSTAITVTPPSAVSGKPPLTFAGRAGVFYYGAEFCAYCAADRWALLASLSRFGTFADLGLIRSTTAAAPPGIESFTLRTVDYTSRYVALGAVEHLTDYNPTGAGFTQLEEPTPAEQLLLSAFHVESYPFIDFGNRFVTSGVSYSPTFLSGLTWTQIGSMLHEPAQPVTRAIVALSNYFSAATCDATAGRPASVCASRGVEDAARAMGLAPGR